MGSFIDQVRSEARTFCDRTPTRARVLAELAIEQASSDRDEARDSVAESDVFEPHSLIQPSLQLFDYQREVLAEAMDRCRAGSAALLSLPTGAGKTRTAFVLALELLRAKVVDTVVWLAPSGELVRQAVCSLSALWQEAAVLPRLEVLGLVEGNPRSASIRFGTVQLAVSRLEQVRLSGPSLVVFDEAHQASARTYQRIVRVARSKGAFVLGLSATPGRANEAQTRAIVELFGGALITPPCLGADPIGALRERGVLSKIEVVSLANELRDKGLWEGCLLELQVPDRSPGLVFASSVAECYIIAAALSLVGLEAMVVSHHQPLGMRERRLEALRRNQLDWIVNVGLLATGVDLPTLCSVALWARLGSPILFEQIIGRVCRGPSVGGRARTYVIDPHGLFEQFGGISSYARFIATDW